MHALSEIRRVLAPTGVLVDLRPVADRWPLEIATATKSQVAGRLQDLPAQLDDDAASAEAIAHAAQAGWFVSERVETFDFLYYWDTLEEMKAYIDEQWEDYVSLPGEVYRQAQVLWADGGADRQVRVRVKLLIGCWQKAAPIAPITNRRKGER